MRLDRTTAGIVLAIVGVAILAGGLGAAALSVDADREDPDGGNLSEDTPVEEELAAVHESGITGENVSIGVLDVRGYELEHPGFEDRVADAQAFGDGPPVDDGQHHGTATAATIASVAPDAELYLGTFEGAEGYAAGLEWMLDRDVDVLVTPVAYAGTLGDGESALSRATTDAIDHGLVVVAPTGNLAGGHWLGSFSPTDDGRLHQFDDGPLNEIEGPPGRAEFWLAAESNGEFSLELHRIEEGSTELLARSTPFDDRTQRLTADLEADRYAIAVRGSENATGETIRISSTTHSFSESRSERSVTAPAAAPGVLAIGAYDPTTGDPEPYSSRGPTIDGRLGVYAVAPAVQSVPGDDRPFVGTSAAAAYAGGVAALAIEAGPELEPDAVRWTIASTAEPIDGVDAETGHGAVDPAAAIAAAAERNEDGESD